MTLFGGRQKNIAIDMKRMHVRVKVCLREAFTIDTSNIFSSQLSKHPRPSKKSDASETSYRDREH